MYKYYYSKNKNEPEDIFPAFKHAYERENKTIINPELIGKLIEGSEIIRIRHLKNEPTKVKGYVSAYLQYGNSYLNELNSNKKVKIEQHLFRIIQKARNEPKQSIEYVAQIVTCTDFKEVKELK